MGTKYTTDFWFPIFLLHVSIASSTIQAIDWTVCFCFYGATDPCGPRPSHYRGFTITFTRTTLGSLDQGSAWYRNLYLIHNDYNRQTSMPPPPGGIRTRSPSKGEAADRTAISIGFSYVVSLHCHSERLCNDAALRCYTELVKRQETLNFTIKIAGLSVITYYCSTAL
jgi:hypothetical protein